MKKILFCFAMIIAFSSCSKFDMLFNCSCTVENATTLEEMVPAEILAKSVSNSTVVDIYETSASSDDEKYGVRHSKYILNYGEKTEFVLDSRTKYVTVVLTTKVNSVTEGEVTEYETSLRTTYLPIETNMKVILKKNSMNM